MNRSAVTPAPGRWAEGCGGGLCDEGSTATQSCHQEEPLLAASSAQVIRFNGMQTALSRTRWARSRVNLSYCRTIELICVCSLVLLRSGLHGEARGCPRSRGLRQHWQCRGARSLRLVLAVGSSVRPGLKRDGREVEMMHKTDPEKPALPFVPGWITVPPGAVSWAVAAEQPRCRAGGNGGAGWVLGTRHRHLVFPTLRRQSPEVLSLDPSGTTRSDRLRRRSGFGRLAELSLAELSPAELGCVMGLGSPCPSAGPLALEDKPGGSREGAPVAALVSNPEPSVRAR